MRFVGVGYGTGDILLPPKIQSDFVGGAHANRSSQSSTATRVLHGCCHPRSSASTEVNTWPRNGTVIRKIESFRARRLSAGGISSRRELPASVQPFCRRREQLWPKSRPR